ncbi:signal recognition particle-docking protein FtsY [Mesorhizobium xinjiangense]|uniref:signal recognition particle-docking protein FtsY n=1 Tax=Mesorhizobium xinjiangense TaxID=2678685 RepID=UPI0012EDC292|nr:signal recognition particle-docking protein FtsY [Mesorhizobium xinjiangense]
MAFGFIKKVFSFGKKEVEERPDETEAAALPPATETEAAPTPTPPQPPAEPAADETVAPAPQPVSDEDKTEPEQSAPPPLEEKKGEAETSAPVSADQDEKDEPEAPAAPLQEPELEEPEREEQHTATESTPQPAAASDLEEADIAPTPPQPRQQSDASPVLRQAQEEESAPEFPVPADERESEDPHTGVDSASAPDDVVSTTPDVDEDEDVEAPAPQRVTVAKSVEQKTEPAPAPELAAKPSWFQRLRSGLSRSSKELSGNIAGVFTKRKLDEDTLQDLEDVLIQADLGLETAMRVTGALASGRYGRDVSDAEVRAVMAEEIEKVLAPVAQPLELDLSHRPHVVLVVGVNGTGKTTTIGKLAAKLVQGGLSVTLAAGDTFRAAAIEQLKIWGERTGSPVIASKLGADAAGLAYDAFEKAKEAGSDVLIIDTAGRLQNKAELMAELEKIVRVLGKLDPEAPHTVLQTVDATTGQNALNQVEIFRNVAGVNGLIMTKLDGTARGGILVSIAAKHKLPVYFIGIGEQVDDLEPFSAGDFAKAIAGVD